MKKIHTTLLGLLLILISVFPLAAQLPKMILSDIEGRKVDVSTLVGQGRPVIISFFATWCKPCLMELSAISEVYADWQEATNVRMLAISIDKGSNSLRVKPLVRSRGWEYEVLLDPNEELKRHLGVVYLPTVFVYDTSGKEIYRHTGYSSGSEEELIQAIRKSKKQ